jgi:hypothetical protein
MGKDHLGVLGIDGIKIGLFLKMWTGLNWLRIMVELGFHNSG